MKALVAVKRVVDYNVKVKVAPDESGVVLENVKMSLNPFDEIALEEAMRQKEAGILSEVIAVSIGKIDVQESLRQALAFGADRAILVECTETLRSLQVAKILKHIAQQEAVDLVLLGKQAIDDDNNQTAQMLAGLLNWPQACFASKLSYAQSEWHVVREVDGGLETLGLTAPCVISVDLRLNTPRFITLPNIMKAKSKPLQVVKANELGLSLSPQQQLLKVSKPEPRKAGVKVDSVETLLEKLRTEAKVL